MLNVCKHGITDIRKGRGLMIHSISLERRFRELRDQAIKNGLPPSTIQTLDDFHKKGLTPDGIDFYSQMIEKAITITKEVKTND